MIGDNVLDLAKARVKLKVESTSSWCGPCPGCGGEDRFFVKPAENDGHGSYYCRGCQKGGDRIQFLMDFEDMTFKEACAELGIEKDPAPRRMRTPMAPAQEEGYQPREYASPQELWRAKFGELVEFCHQALLKNPAQLAYLAKRGIDLAAVKRFRLGWNPGKDGRDLYRARKAWGAPEAFKADGVTPKKLWIPRGIVIPYFVDGVLQRVRIRRAECKDDFGKYIVMPGSTSAAMVVNPDAQAFVVVEAELDAMALDCQVADPRVGYLAVLTNQGKPDTVAWPLLQGCLRILVALDFDDLKPDGRRPGYEGWIWWKHNFQDVAKRWPPAAGKDPGDAFAAGEDLATWVRAGLPPRLTVGPLLPDLERGGAGLPEEKVEVATSEKLARGKRSSAEAPAEFVDMANLLKGVPLGLRIGNGIEIIEDPRWTGANSKNFDRFAAVSKAFFGASEALFDYIADHPATVVNGDNFWQAWDQLSRGDGA